MLEPPASQNDFTAELVAVQRRLLGYILALVPSLTNAEDILQSTNAAILHKSGEYESIRDFTGWVCRVAYYEVLEWRRNRARDRQVLAMGMPLLEQLADEALEHIAKQDDVFVALEHCEQKLIDKERHLIHLRYQQDLSIDEISSQTSRTTAAVRQALHRIRDTLLVCIQRQLSAQERGA